MLRNFRNPDMRQRIRLKNCKTFLEIRERIDLFSCFLVKKVLSRNVPQLAFSGRRATRFSQLEKCGAGIFSRIETETSK